MVAPRLPAALRHRVAAGWPWPLALALAAVVLGPALRPGYLLHHDLITGPDPAVTVDTVGLGDRLPRAVPWDGAVALVGLLGGDRLVGQLAALLALTMAGAGAARLAQRDGAVHTHGIERWVALLVAIWNPFVMEQLAIGHVPHLLAYGALAWLVIATRALRRGRPGGWSGSVLAVVLGSLTPGGGLLCCATVIVVALTDWWHDGRPRRDRGVAVAVVTVLVLQLPWVVAAVMHPAASRAVAEADSPFAVRAESAAGVIVDVLGLGGNWAQATLPASRSTWLGPATTGLLLTLAVLGLAGRVSGRRRTAGEAAQAGRGEWALPLPALLTLMTGGYLIALMPRLPGGTTLLRVVGEVPGAGLLRDGHRWLAWPALGLAVLAGSAARRLADLVEAWAVPSPAAAGTAAVLVSAAVIALAPDLAGGLAGRLHTSEYPPDWARTRIALTRHADDDRIVVLPWQPFRRFAWAGPQNVLDPAGRVMPRATLTDDSLTVGGRSLPAEGAGSRAVRRALADQRLSADELRPLAVGWILIEHGTPGALPQVPEQAEVVISGPDLTLYRLDGATPVPLGRWRVRCVVGSQLLLALLASSATLRLLALGALTWTALLRRRWPGSSRRPAPI